MKRIFILSIVLAGMLMAYETPVYTTFNTDILPSNHLSISLINAKMDYKEYGSDGSILDKQEADWGDLFGISGKYEFDLNDNWSISLKGRYLIGTTIYYGSAVNLTTGQITPIVEEDDNGFIFNMKALVNRKLITNDKYLLKGNFGFGYRYWKRGYNKNDPADYEEDYKWPYSTVGLNLKLKFSSYADFSMFGSYAIAINPKMVSHLAGTTTFDLGNTYGRTLGFNMNFYFNTEKISGLSLGYRNIYWKIDHSDNKTINIDGQNYQFYEPNSKTYINEMSLSYFFNF